VEKEARIGKKVTHLRTLVRGEIIGRIRLCLDVLYTEAIPFDERNNTYSVDNLIEMIGGSVEPWVKRYSRNKEFRLTPSLVLRALHTMKKMGYRFRIDNENDAVRLLRKGESLTVHHILVKRR
jgi:hypothetical protein